MLDFRSDEMGTPVIPPGLTAKYLIDPNYVAASQWGLYCISDRLSFSQIEVLIDSAVTDQPNIYGLFGTGAERHSVHLKRSAEAIAMFFVEMVGGDVCVFDMPNSFLISVLEGDLTLVATRCSKLRQMFGSSEMSRAHWLEIAEGLRGDISAKLLTTYVKPTAMDSLADAGA